MEAKYGEPWSGKVNGKYQSTEWEAVNYEAYQSEYTPVLDSTGRTVLLIVNDAWDDKWMDAMSAHVVGSINACAGLNMAGVPEGAVKRALDVLRRLIVGSCSCLTKTDDPAYHAEDCKYRIIMDALAPFKKD